MKKFVLIDDLDHESEADETVTFALDGKSFEIDLTEENAAELRETLQPYVAAARNRDRRTPRRPNGATPYSDVDRKAVRAWAKGKKIKLADRGRIPVDVIEKYLADNPG